MAFRLVEVLIRGRIGLLFTGKGLFFLAEVLLTLAGALILFVPERRSRATWQVRAAILLLLGGALFRVNTYLVAFNPGNNWSYFPSFTELLITFGIFAAEIAVYLAIVKMFPILSGARHAASRS